MYILYIDDKSPQKTPLTEEEKECPVIYLWIVELQHSLKKSNVCSLSLLNKYVKIVCGWKFVFKPASPEYVVSRRPNKATNYLVLLIFCKQQEGQHGPNKTSSLKGFHVNKQHFFRTTCHSFDIISLLKTSAFWINRKNWTTFSSKKVILVFDLTLHIYKQKKVNISTTKQNMLPSYQVSRDGAKKVFREIGLETWYVPQSQSLILAPHSH